MFLKRGDDLPALSDQCADAPAPLRRDVANLDAAAGVDRDRQRVGWVLGFGPKFDRLPALADGEFEAAGRAALVGVIGADDGEGECGEAQPLLP